LRVKRYVARPTVTDSNVAMIKFNVIFVTSSDYSA
jgi:hypothetical protein